MHARTAIPTRRKRHVSGQPSTSYSTDVGFHLVPYLQSNDMTKIQGEWRPQSLAYLG